MHGMQQYLPLFEAIVPAGWRRAVAERIPVRSLRNMIQIVDTLRTRSSAIFAEKKRALLAGDEALKQQVGEGKDLMSILRGSFRSALGHGAWVADEANSEGEYGGKRGGQDAGG